MTLPNFLILGAAKSGTTALYRYLSEHPDIYLSSYKEPRFLLYEGADPNQFKGPGDSDRVREAIRNLKDYEKLFDNVSHETAIGEASPIYLPLPPRHLYPQNQNLHSRQQIHHPLAASR